MKLVLCLLSYLAAYGIVLSIIYPHLPPIIPSHWNASGHIDGYSSKLTMAEAGLIPILALPVTLYPIIFLLTSAIRQPFPSKPMQWGVSLGSGLLTAMWVGHVISLGKMYH
jgi:uncharacterized membrane protein